MRISILPNLISFLVYFSQLILLISVQSDSGITHPFCNNTNGNYTSNSRYSKNLHTLMSTMSSNYSNDQINGFYNLSVGEGLDVVYGITLCRGDYSRADCQNYLSDATNELPALCPVQKEATGYYSAHIMLRYSNRPLLELRDNSPTFTNNLGLLMGRSATVLRQYNQTLINLLEVLKRNAASGNSSFKYASSEEDVNESLKIYGFAQCNPYLSYSDCSHCLEVYNIDLARCCGNYDGRENYGTICSVTFATYPVVAGFTNTSLQPILVAPPNAGIKSGKRIWIAVMGAVSSMLIATLIFVLSTRKNRTKPEQDQGNGQMKLVDSLHLHFSSLQFATDNFSDSNRLGNDTGTDGTVMYKGVLPHGQEIVVKKLHKGDTGSELEFDNDVLLSANLQHKNLVKLLGYCIEKELRFLVYEFLPSGSLRDFLNDPVKRAKSDWQTRFVIINGLARGLLYLHEDCPVRVIHRDLKPSNVLLGAQMESKISNFRTASLVQADQTRGDTRVVGTYGYMPQEYVQHGHSSIKSDVFSYGVLLLEVITGYMITGFSTGNGEENLLSYVWRKWCGGSTLDVVDQVLPITQIQKHINQIERCIQIALLCVQEDTRDRPMMSNVVQMLNSDTVDITKPIKPAPLILHDIDHHSDCHTTSTSQSDKSHETTLNEVSISSCFEPR